MRKKKKEEEKRDLKMKNIRYDDNIFTNDVIRIVLSEVDFAGS